MNIGILWCHFIVSQPGIRQFSWLGHGANKAKAEGSIPIRAIHLRAGFDDPCGVPSHNSEYSVITLKIT